MYIETREVSTIKFHATLYTHQTFLRRLHDIMETFALYIVILELFICALMSGFPLPLDDHC